MVKFDKCDCDEYTKLYKKCLNIINSSEEICINELEINKNKK